VERRGKLGRKSKNKKYQPQLHNSIIYYSFY
jgi:hypothetical protein